MGGVIFKQLYIRLPVAVALKFTANLSVKPELQQVRQIEHGVGHFIAFVQVMTITDSLL